MLKTLPSNARGVGLIPNWKARIPMPRGQKSKTLNRSNIVTSLIKTLKIAHIKKKLEIINIVIGSSMELQFEMCVFSVFPHEMQLLRAYLPQEKWGRGLLSHFCTPWHFGTKA